MIYPNQLPNLYQYQTPVNNFNQNQLIRVTGLDGAKAYQMNANSTVALFDSGADVMYIKSTDGAGFPTIRTFAFTEVTETQKAETVDYITRAEFNEFKKEIKDAKQPISRTRNKTTDIERYDE